MHILIVEDDIDLGFALQKALKTNGLSSEWVRRVDHAPRSFESAPFDCILLDLCLPGGAGLDLLKLWRDDGIVIPIIVITARSALDDRLAGLDSGADDYLVKPFATAELISRIYAVQRRYVRQASDIWSVGDIEIEPRKYLARLNGTLLDLSPREFRLILELAREPGVVMPKGELSQRLEPLGDPVDFSAIEVHISNLRRKIGAHRIQTVHGVGYTLAS
ncbi:response regulator transcription factor [Solimicrobium silvestre]|uniref:Response regulators consisting of a CheY-like receiver domain and a winged-helix DNA-binding domain n=1 Tax=Solimicrobium silvestre TaxID=2099400 RepID=A0A2S9GWP4_9BURK|nr:response regulator transcription factor [Solimicrobium silvestre]PRC92139.1 Response regulators consisting of a CheY-like receiver domain and a winged-helix DNA-binding domain [Solimicrobium silvestre]